jgi:lipid II:glycine glycyltransferase (peptidoglycan interpeptide bridge formation enzyme)
MLMTINGVPTTIVEKLLDNLKELTRNVSEVSIKTDSIQDSIDESAEKVAAALTKVAERLNTPPRHEELEKEIKELDKKLDSYEKVEQEQTELLKSVIKTIKIASSLFGLAILIAAILMTVVEKTKYSNIHDQKIELIEKTVQDHMKDDDKKFKEVLKK